ncbi:MAG: signal recognition particle protein [Cytophagales bacterium]
MFQTISEKLGQVISHLRGKRKITEQNIKQTLKETRRSLVDAGVSYKIAKTFVDQVKKEALGTLLETKVSAGHLFIKMLEDKLALLMGAKTVPISTEGKPAIIMLVGNQGAGKTTLAAKLAKQFTTQGKTTLLTSCDIYRPAAMDQLAILGKEVGVDTYLDKTEKDPLAIAKRAIEMAKKKMCKIVILDTAGRQVVDQKMMAEIALLKKELQPAETLFVVDAMMGQSAVETATAFHAEVQFDGVVLTKMDGDTRGGVALTIREITGKPIKLVSTGEKMMDLEVFHPDRMAKRILGQGDVVTLVERAQKVFDEQKSRKLAKKFHQRKFDFNDLLQQFRQVKKMGSLKTLLSLIPGVKKLIGNREVNDQTLKDFEVMVQSMKPKERKNPDLIDHHVKLRLASGSGLGRERVVELFQQFEQMRNMFKKGNYKKYMQQMMQA